MLLEHLNKDINNFLQRNIVFMTKDNKTFKHGKLIMYKFKDFYMTFTIKHGNSIKILELPYPFKTDLQSDHMIFSYEIGDLCKPNTEVYFKTKLLTPQKKNKLYNNTVVLSSVNV